MRWEHAEVAWQPHQFTLSFFMRDGARQHVLPTTQWASTFHQLGEEGWELVSTIASPTGVHEYWYYFKRPRP
jgi:predicted cupin superfamily sugar epimerase